MQHDEGEKNASKPSPGIQMGSHLYHGHTACLQWSKDSHPEIQVDKRERYRGNGCCSCYCAPGQKVFVYLCCVCCCYDNEQVRVLFDHQEYPGAAMKATQLKCMGRTHSPAVKSKTWRAFWPVLISFKPDMTLWEEGSQLWTKGGKWHNSMLFINLLSATDCMKIPVTPMSSYILKQTSGLDVLQQFDHMLRCILTK